MRIVDLASDRLIANLGTVKVVNHGEEKVRVHMNVFCVIRESILFRPRETGFPFFRDA